MEFSVRNPVRGMYRGSWDKIQKSSLRAVDSFPMRLGGGLVLKVKWADRFIFISDFKRDSPRVFLDYQYTCLQRKNISRIIFH